MQTRELLRVKSLPFQVVSHCEPNRPLGPMVHHNPINPSIILATWRLKARSFLATGRISGRPPRHSVVKNGAVSPFQGVVCWGTNMLRLKHQGSLRKTSTGFHLGEMDEALPKLPASKCIESLHAVKSFPSAAVYQTHQNPRGQSFICQSSNRQAGDRNKASFKENGAVVFFSINTWYIHVYSIYLVESPSQLWSATAALPNSILCLQTTSKLIPSPITKPRQILKPRVHLQFWEICGWPIWL